MDCQRDTAGDIYGRPEHRWATQPHPSARIPFPLNTRTPEPDTRMIRGLKREAYRLRLTEDLISMKVRLVQGGRPTRTDLAALARVHTQALENVAVLCGGSSGAPPPSEMGTLGLRSTDVEVMSYDPRWPLFFGIEAEIIRNRLGALAIAVHHIGSTSIPGMPAKPLVDIAVSVDPEALPARLADYILAMESIGYRFYGDFGHRGGYYFSKHDGALQTFTVQFHSSDSWDLARLLKFRDAARQDPDLFRDYSTVKVALASALGGNRGLYYWYKGHWLNDRLLVERGPDAWGNWFLLAQYPTMFQMALRFAVSRLRPRSLGPGLSPMAIRRRR
jgi:GrpB-like predicted nucleotidyltransferase (UPF0157 family)